ncbi:MAG: DoxX family membrane protein [Deltaproteobacteria bacterium]|nr:MAG: DoxX family membrane protein [Deltaproteobacteria bacterium]TMB16078.1 MAG: DoxX family membrane protein [Deltaproteobacteria bacterium]
MMARALAVCRVALGALFIWAAVTKLPDMTAFAQDVANYRVIPAALVPLLAAAVVGIELLAGIALVTGVMERSAAAVLAVLLGAFTVLLTQALLRGIDLRCGCFGGDERASWWTVLRDLVMLATALAVARGRAPERTRVTYPA